MVRKAYLNRELEHIETGLKAVSGAIREKSINQTSSGMRILLEQYPQLPDSELTMAISGVKDAAGNSPAGTELQSNSWERTEWEINYKRADYKPENLVHRTSFGLFVRTKSEALIAEKLYMAPVQIRYEEVLEFPERICIPDFTILRSDGKVFYWEHEGLMNVVEYKTRQRSKHEIYINHGIVPWDNLIVTYDYGEGEIDLKIVESEIENKLVI